MKSMNSTNFNLQNLDTDCEAFSGVSTSGAPLVELRWSGFHAYISPDEARDLAQSLLGAAVAAEGDAMLLRFFRAQEFPDGAFEVMMQMWRTFKDAEAAISNKDAEAAISNKDAEAAISK